MPPALERLVVRGAGARSGEVPRVARLTDAAAHQAAWWWCVLCARADLAWLALAGPLAYVGAHVALRPAWRSRVLVLAVFGALLGLCGDALLVHAGYLASRPALERGATLPFMASLWSIAAVSLTLSSAFVASLAPWQAALAGVVVGPLAYAGGARLSVLVLAPGAPLLVAVEWALLLPLVTRCARALGRPQNEAAP
ncbi:MAG TPA: DUF2878 family protein [Polyangiaceae bacterium]|nr:DUF2878 family protein [Polyangiaceae bacterium]